MGCSLSKKENPTITNKKATRTVTSDISVHLGVWNGDSTIGANVKLVDASTFYSILQYGIKTHSVAVFYTGPSAEFENDHIKGALDITKDLVNQVSESSKRWFLKLCELKTVMLYGQGLSATLLSRLSNYLTGSNQKEIIALNDTTRKLRENYELCFASSNIQMPGPYEIVPPRTSSAFALYTSDLNVFVRNQPALCVFDVKNAIHLVTSQEDSTTQQRDGINTTTIRIDEQNGYWLAVDAIWDANRRKQAILIVDSQAGLHTFTIAIWFLLENGFTSDKALELVNRKNPSCIADSFLLSSLNAGKQIHEKEERREKMSAIVHQRFAGPILSKDEGSKSLLNQNMPLKSTLSQSDFARQESYFDIINSLVYKLKNRVNNEDFKSAMSVLNKIINNILIYPNEDKFRKLKASNTAFYTSLGRHPEGVELLVLAGFIRTTEFDGYELPASQLFQKMRDINIIISPYID